jgi:glycosyltransferase involved in cell wall biosynthesis
MIRVSVVVPCFNEQSTIPLLLGAIYHQTYPRQEVEVIIADGMSTDSTRAEIDTFSQAHPELTVRVVENVKRTIPSAFNQALKSAQGEFIVRMDAHSIPRPDYVERCVAALEQDLGDNVGGVWDIQPGGEGWAARSIAVAAAHPLGVGDAHYRHTTQPQWVDTVPFGSYHKSLFDRIGDFDETLLANEDYEFNTRIRQSGGKIWLDPKICSTYFARSTFRDLAQQYWRYGSWKWRMLRRYPRTLRWRQALPPLFVLSLVFLGIISIFYTLAVWLLAVEIGLYGIILLMTAISVSAKRRDPALIFGFHLAVITMHIFWGSGFLWSMCTPS